MQFYLIQDQNINIYDSKSSNNFANYQKVVILVKYLDFINIFLKKLTIKLFEQLNIKKYAINLKLDKQPFYKLFFNLRLIKLKILIIYIKKKFIMPKIYDLQNTVDVIWSQCCNFLGVNPPLTSQLFFVLIQLYLRNSSTFFLLTTTHLCINLPILTMSVASSLLPKTFKSKKFYIRLAKLIG